ncbi:nucleoside hydrolase [Nonomuraea sp. NPDC000554]|uniref:nucleoside hydrolase n=1 Tax=Nonomuraea sp. NPDC000554 TaxID=3154259 RepID=UPI00331E5A54
MRLVIDTDTASDDAVALMLAIATPGTQVEAITTVAGNVPLPQATANALVTTEFMGADIPVYAGRPGPLLRPAATAQHVHGPDGMSGVALPAPARSPRPEHAVETLVRLARENPRELTLVTLGPLSNVATALLVEPDLLRLYDRVYCMAGAPDGHGNISAVAEYNVWADPEAAAVVLAAPGDVTFVGWNVSRQSAVFTDADQARLRRMGTPRADFLLDVNAAVADWCRTVTGLDGFDLPDPVAMAVALRPDLVLRSERLHAAVATGDESRGLLMIDRRRAAPPPNVTIVWDVDTAAFKADIDRLCAA